MDLVRSCNKAVTQTSKRSLGGMVVGYSVSCNAEMVGVAAISGNGLCHNLQAISALEGM